MNAQDMLDYALGQLDGPARERLERQAEADPETAEVLDRLTRAVHFLLDDGQAYDPPHGLAGRTVGYVEEQVRRRSILDFVPASVPFRWADVAVAASIFVAGILTLLPAFQRSKERMDQAGCAYNLQNIGRALWQYGSIHKVYPYAPPDDPKAHSGTFAAMLHDGGLLHDLRVLDCPSNGSCQRSVLPDLKALRHLRERDPRRYRDLIGWDYAYNVGYHHGKQGPVSLEAVHSGTLPLLADEPSHEGHRIHEGNSPNHGGLGQNVLFADLHVNWHDTRRVGPHDDDLYLNAEHRPAPGLGIHDAALLPSLMPFCGE
jgi:hypothetical protein